MRVWGLVQDPTKHQNSNATLFTLSSIKEFVSGVDYVVNVLPNTQTTNNLLSPYESGKSVECIFEHASKKPVFINVGRGSIHLPFFFFLFLLFI